MSKHIYILLIIGLKQVWGQVRNHFQWVVEVGGACPSIFLKCYIHIFSNERLTLLYVKWIM